MSNKSSDRILTRVRGQNLFAILFYYKCLFVFMNKLVFSVKSSATVLTVVVHWESWLVKWSRCMTACCACAQLARACAVPRRLLSRSLPRRTCFHAFLANKTLENRSISSKSGKNYVVFHAWGRSEENTHEQLKHIITKLHCLTLNRLVEQKDILLYFPFSVLIHVF